MLDVDFHAPDHNVQQVFPRRRIGAEHDLRVGEDFEGAAVGDLEPGVTIRSGLDHLLGPDRVPFKQGPRAAIAQYGDVAIDDERLGRGILGLERGQRHHDGSRH